MTDNATILHVLSQRPSLTGSGVTLDALVRETERAGWQQHAVVGVPAEDPTPAVAELPLERVHPLVFDRTPLDFPVPGMSDVMPYPSTRFSSMDPDQLERYRTAWKHHLVQVIERTQPALIHSHHVWLLSSLLKDIAPDVPVVTQCHATGFRQMELCPHLAGEVRAGCSRNERFLVLAGGHIREIQERIGIAEERVHLVGAGYRQDLFHTRSRSMIADRLAYAGKYSASKGLPWLLDAFENLRRRRPQLELHVAGSGSGPEADALRQRMEAMAGVALHDRLGQPELAELLRRSSVFVLPSFYEGVPLVLVEAAASGCRLVATDLPGIRQELAPSLDPVMQRVPLPRLLDVDQPDPQDLPGFVDALTEAMDQALHQPQDQVTNLEARFSWAAVFQRVESVWRTVLG
jgi:glycosyltransferase involved in cell wall biosynthesis